MKNFRFSKLFTFFILLSVSTELTADNDIASYSFRFRNLSTLNGLPGNDVQKVYQGRDGYIWIASRNGLYQYDGYNIKTFKSNFYNLDLFSNNNIFSIAEDEMNRLWIGTYQGLNVMERKTGRISQINSPEFINNSISKILVTKEGKLLLGTDQGLYQYIADENRIILYGRHNTEGVLPQTSVKSLYEDSRGDIWIGTWSEGIFRYSRDEDKYYAYPRMNPRNSAHVIFEDSKNRIWIGTWGEGLYLLENPYDISSVSWKAYKHTSQNTKTISDNIIYDISEDLNTNTLWVGTRRGLSIWQEEYPEQFLNYYPGTSESSISADEVNSIIRDRQGMMWLGMMGGGVSTVITSKPNFNIDRLEYIKKELNSNSVRSLMVDGEDQIWMGVGTYGLVIHDRKNNKSTHYSQLSDFSEIKGVMPTVLSITRIDTGEIWIGTYDGGILVYDKSAPTQKRVTVYSTGNSPWLAGNCVYAIKQDKKGNLWFGTRYGVSMLTTDKVGVRLDSIRSEGRYLRSAIVTALEEGEEEEMWAATSNHGIIRITGAGEALTNYTLHHYSVINGKLNSTNVMCLYKDSYNRLWAGTEGSGLSLYDPEKDTFIPVHKNWNLPGDAISGILEDSKGNLWLAGNVGLIKLTVGEDFTAANYRLYTTSDGLQDNTFNRNATFMTPEGEMLFGGHQGYNYFYPEQISETSSNLPIIITDIKIYNRSWFDLEEEVKNKISVKAPGFTEKIVLDYQHNNFNIEFAALEYENFSYNKYAYQLIGFDNDWQYTDASRRFAYYNNLNPGTYTFQLRSTSFDRETNPELTLLQVVILPPPWKTWWAYLTYIIIGFLLSLFIYRVVHNRLKLRNALQLREIEQAKSEELNHTKLQFFTNITHELLTPLTIISASIDELKICAPQNEQYYQVMTRNINRLIRLLQQILEFRKAETGNLKLKVSQGDLATFIHNSVESFRPLMKKKKIHFSVVCTPEVFPAYFDPDKIDKIVYNLLSNASKYNNPGGTVWIEVNENSASGIAEIIVKDNGPGISQESQKNLFKRFYEGDYRKFNTIGTGIGLSLVKDLTELHKGSISVKSEAGQGTEFTVLIPVMRKAFKEEEIDDTVTFSAATDKIEYAEEELEIRNEKTYSLLLIEDNEELLQLMVKLLITDYNIFTAGTGKEGLEVIERENVDLVVSDIMMPEMDGIEFCKSVKSNFDICHIPVILLTAKNQEEDRVEAYESGADGFISKPFNLTVLHARISNLLKARERMTKDFKKQLVFEAKELNYTSIDEDFLRRAIECVHNHLSDADYDQGRFVDDMGTSRSTLFRKLKSLTGLSYSSFIRNIRLKAACRIMEEKKSIRVSELAYAVGFNDPKYFSSCFKREFGMQPSEYMEQFMGESEEEDKSK